MDAVNLLPEFPDRLGGIPPGGVPPGGVPLGGIPPGSIPLGVTFLLFV